MKLINLGYLYNVMDIIFSSFPAAQPHTAIKIAPTVTRLCAQNEVLWVKVMCGRQCDFGRNEVIQVPVNTDAMDILSSMNVTQDLQQERVTELKNTDFFFFRALSIYSSHHLTCFIARHSHKLLTLTGGSANPTCVPSHASIIPCLPLWPSEEAGACCHPGS